PLCAGIPCRSSLYPLGSCIAGVQGGGSRPHLDDAGAAPCALLPGAAARLRRAGSWRLQGSAREDRFHRRREDFLDVALLPPGLVPKHRWGACILLPPCRSSLHPLGSCIAPLGGGGSLHHLDDVGAALCTLFAGAAAGLRIATSSTL